MNHTPENVPTGERLRELHGEQYAAEYRDKPMNRLTRLLPFMRLRPQDHVCDFACGDGMLMEAIAGHVGRYAGVDFSAPMVALAQARQARLGIDNAEFFVDDITRFCEAHPGVFDAAFAMDFSEHVPDDEWLRIARAIRSSLKPDGRFYLHTPDADYLLERLKAAGVLPQFPQHVAVRNRQHNESLLRAAGFNEIRTRQLPHYEARQAWIHPLRRVPFVGKLFSARLFMECC